MFAAESARALLVVVARIDAVNARQLLDDGVLFVDVLPEAIFVQEHLPGAISLPLATLTPEAADRAAADGLRSGEPFVVYCFDQHCDLSARACRRFEQLGFTKVHDLIGGRAAWTVLGYPTEGQVGDRRRVSAHVLDAPRVHIDATVSDVRAAQTDHRPVAVVDDAGVLLGAVQETAEGLPATTAVADIMAPAPGTVRVDQRVDDVLAQLRKDHLQHAYVTNAEGKLVGLVVPDEVHV